MPYCVVFQSICCQLISWMVSYTTCQIRR
jgi:hypothetical protein